jgi:hypothetical protein
MYTEFQREKEDLLESIRMLQDQMQLKDMVIEAFIPPEEVQKVRLRPSTVCMVSLIFLAILHDWYHHLVLGCFRSDEHISFLFA